MEKVKTFFIPCHGDDAHLAVRPDCRCFPPGAKIYVDYQAAMESLLSDPFLLTAPNLLVVTISAQMANKLAFENKLQSPQAGEWIILRSAESEFMHSLLQIRLLVEPQKVPSEGKRTAMYAVVTSTQPDSPQHCAWNAALRINNGESETCDQARLVATLFPSRKSALELMRKVADSERDVNIGLLTMWVLDEKAQYALSILRSYDQGYRPSADHYQLLVEQSVCQLELFSIPKIAAVNILPPRRADGVSPGTIAYQPAIPEGLH
jgi:hypothetical protein